MAKIYGELEKAQLENTAADPGTLAEGMVWLNTTSKIAKVRANTATHEILTNDQTQTVTGKTFDDALLLKELTTPATPATGYYKQYIKNDGAAYILNDAGAETPIAGLPGTPVGSILPWMSGYFTSNANAGFTDVLTGGTSEALANAYLNPLGFYVCDGAAPNDPASPIWNAAGRYLPKLNDDRFLMGSTTAGQGATTGSNTLRDHLHPTFGLAQAHSHTATTAGGGAHLHNFILAGSLGTNALNTSAHRMLSDGAIPSFEYRITRASAGEPDLALTDTFADHTHTLTTTTQSITSVTGTIGAGVNANLTENRPLYLSCFYIMKVK